MRRLRRGARCPTSRRVDPQRPGASPGASCADEPPLVRLIPKGNAAHRRSAGRADTPLACTNVTLDELRDRVAPFAVGRYAAGHAERKAVSSRRRSALVDLALGAAPPAELEAEPSPPVLLLEVPSAALLAHQPLLELDAFDAALRTLNGGSLHPQGGVSGFGSLWIKCLQMVRRNRCSAVC